jgi:hypothetical protein
VRLAVGIHDARVRVRPVKKEYIPRQKKNVSAIVRKKLDRGRAMVPTTNAPARRTKVWAVGLIIVLAAVATGVAFLIMHLTKKKE